jgi:hypothetical protein
MDLWLMHPWGPDLELQFRNASRLGLLSQVLSAVHRNLSEMMRPLPGWAMSADIAKTAAVDRFTLWGAELAAANGPVPSLHA